MSAAQYEDSALAHCLVCDCGQTERQAASAYCALCGHGQGPESWPGQAAQHYKGPPPPREPVVHAR